MTKWKIYRNKPTRKIIKLKTCPRCMKLNPNYPNTWGKIPADAGDHRHCFGCHLFIQQSKVK